MKVVTRFPPSPTGYFHIGSARTALFNYLFAAHEGGRMYLRFEDTDRERSKKEYEDDILEGLSWLEIPYARSEIIRQSERTHIYRDYLRKLIDTKAAYEAEPTTNDPGRKVIRFRNPNTTVPFNDLVRGEVTFDTTDLKDFVIAKNIDEPLYHLAVVIDDHEAGVTHVIRGEDHVSNTSRQILILEALGFARPQYAHIPLILAPDRSKLSKRHGAVSVNEYRAEGYLPQALVNYLALLGWNPGTEKEIFTLDELVAEFRIGNVQKGGAIFDLEKLRWFNHEHLKRLTDAEFAKQLEALTGSAVNAALVPLLKERARTLKEAEELVTTGELSFLGDTLSYDPALFLKGAKTDARIALTHLAAIARMLEDVPGDDFNDIRIKDAIFPYATSEGRGAVLWPLRVALSGREKSPDPFVIAALVGKERTLRRIDIARTMLENI